MNIMKSKSTKLRRKLLTIAALLLSFAIPATFFGHFATNSCHKPRPRAKSGPQTCPQTCPQAGSQTCSDTDTCTQTEASRNRNDPGGRRHIFDGVGRFGCE